MHRGNLIEKYIDEIARALNDGLKEDGLVLNMINIEQKKLELINHARTIKAVEGFLKSNFSHLTNSQSANLANQLCHYEQFVSHMIKGVAIELILEGGGHEAGIELQPINGQKDSTENLLALMDFMRIMRSTVGKYLPKNIVDMFNPKPLQTKERRLRWFKKSHSVCHEVKKRIIEIYFGRIFERESTLPATCCGPKYSPDDKAYVSRLSQECKQHLTLIKKLRSSFLKKEEELNTTSLQWSKGLDELNVTERTPLL